MAGISMIFILVLVILAGFGTKETEETYTVFPCSKIAKIAKLHCYNQTIMNKGLALKLAGITYNPENNANVMRNRIKDIDPKYWNCTNEESFINSVMDYGPIASGGKTIMTWDKLEVLNKTHVFLSGQRLNNSAAKNISLKNFDLMWWTYLYGKSISTLDWDCETRKASIKRLRVLVGENDNKLEVPDSTKEDKIT